MKINIKEMRLRKVANIQVGDFLPCLGFVEGIKKVHSATHDTVLVSGAINLLVWSHSSRYVAILYDYEKNLLK